MRYVILRDDDTNALTPVECLERLYRPFLDRGLPVNLAVIPNVRTDATRGNGRLEGFLVAKNGVPEWSAAGSSSTSCSGATDISHTAPIGSNRRLRAYLCKNPGYHIVQHGYQHDYLEFDSDARPEISRRLEEGMKLLQAAGFPKPQTFVAPYDRFCRASLAETARHFAVISSGWYELRRLPPEWWPNYLVKKIARTPHWQVNGSVLLTHPGCLLSCDRDRQTMMAEILQRIHGQRLTVLVTHWWEYFPNHQPDEDFIGVLHELADYLADSPEIKVISFAQVAKREVPLQ